MKIGPEKTEHKNLTKPQNHILWEVAILFPFLCFFFLGWQVKKICWSLILIASIKLTRDLITIKWNWPHEPIALLYYMIQQLDFCITKYRYIAIFIFIKSYKLKKVIYLILELHQFRIKITYLNFARNKNIYHMYIYGLGENKLQKWHTKHPGI